MSPWTGEPRPYVMHLHTKTPDGEAEGFYCGRRADGILSDWGGLRKGVIQKRTWRNGSQNESKSWMVPANYDRKSEQHSHRRTMIHLV